LACKHGGELALADGRSGRPAGNHGSARGAEWCPGGSTAHSYERRLLDTAIGGCEVVICLWVRRFSCPSQECAKVTFAEQVSRLTSRHARPHSCGDRGIGQGADQPQQRLRRQSTSFRHARSKDEKDAM
jgi:hypothetical protein